ncbi:MAG: lipase 1-like protein [Candidatus Saccharibacteria bacterium]|nr:lipase 1-like protein [Candidatus Saccharibacteria bacterium]
MLDTFTHRWLKIPYTLNVRHNQRPKKAKQTVLFIHGIGNSGDAWNEVIAKLPNDIRIITIDLLGFGESPSPKWAIYSAKTQTRSVLATLIKLRLTTPIIVVGHSLGSLVAIEMAIKYPIIINRLILCSPPLYDDRVSRLPRSDNLRKQLYRAAMQHPDQFLRMAAFGTKYKLINSSFNVTAENIDSYVATLNTMIINQTSLDDAYKLKVPTTIIKGTLDPFVIAKNLRSLAKSNENIKVKTIIAGHEVRGRYIRPLVATIKEQVRFVNKQP